ncbi:MAG: DUF502 domain-containing protein, partial [Deltaproteobacteria bacterium]|nr:DUF502 domain-containing protein [Deltaproteobacteria bacterium]
RSSDLILGAPLDALLGLHVPGLGIMATIVLVFLVGLFTTNVVGRRLLEWAERLLVRVPVVKSIYLGSKQLVEAITLPGKQTFKRVVMIEYPRRGLYAVGFITSTNIGEVHGGPPDGTSTEYVVNVFVPATPNVTSGTLILVPKKEIIPLSLSVEDGVKLVVSGGIVSPPKILAGLSRDPLL